MYQSADIGESSEIILGVTIDEKPGSLRILFNNWQKAITEFNYRYSDNEDVKFLLIVKQLKALMKKEILLRNLK